MADKGFSLFYEFTGRQRMATEMNKVGTNSKERVLPISLLAIC